MGFGLKMNGHSKDVIKQKVDEASRILQLDDYLKRKPKALSGGQRQRVAIGRAIVRGPEVFLFDEPLSNLDAELRVDMRVEIARLHKEIGATMIYVTHDQVEAMTLADKIVVLRAGQIEQVGSPMSLYSDPDNMFVAGFIGSPSMNFLEGKVQNGKVVVPSLDGREISTNVTLPAEGKSVIVGIRPQHITLNANQGSARLDLRELLGGVSYDYLTLKGGEKVIVESHSEEALPEGNTIGITFDDSKCMFFDSATQQRCRSQ